MEIQWRSDTLLSTNQIKFKKKITHFQFIHFSTKSTVHYNICCFSFIEFFSSSKFSFHHISHLISLIIECTHYKYNRKLFANIHILQIISRKKHDTIFVCLFEFFFSFTAEIVIFVCFILSVLFLKSI